MTTKTSNYGGTYYVEQDSKTIGTVFKNGGSIRELSWTAEASDGTAYKVGSKAQGVEMLVRHAAKNA